MRTTTKALLSLTLLFLPVLPFAASRVSADPAPPTIVGDYVEARTCDVWTGPCFSNSEINLRGDHAVMAWAVREGTWNGVRLDGLKVSVSLDAQGTFGTDAEGRVRAALFVDEGASAPQQKALVSLVKELAPSYTKHIVRIEPRKISFSRSGSVVDLEVARAGGKPGADVKVRTKPLSRHCDTICGNEEKAYPSLSKFASAECAKVVRHFYRGAALGPRWADADCRGAMAGEFRVEGATELSKR